MRRGVGLFQAKHEGSEEVSRPTDGFLLYAIYSLKRKHSGHVFYSEQLYIHTYKQFDIKHNIYNLRTFN